MVNGIEEVIAVERQLEGVVVGVFQSQVEQCRATEIEVSTGLDARVGLVERTRGITKIG